VGHAESRKVAIESNPHIAFDVVGQVFGNVAGVEDHEVEGQRLKVAGQTFNLQPSTFQLIYSKFKFCSSINFRYASAAASPVTSEPDSPAQSVGLSLTNQPSP